MMELLGVAPQVLFGQLLVGLINGSFYALLSLGLAVIFGMLHIVNMAHGVFYMLSAFFGWLLLTRLGLGYWWALLLTPLMVGGIGLVLERTLLRRLYRLDPLYGLLLTFGFALVLEGTFRHLFGVSGQGYPVPELLKGGHNLGFMYLPNYRAWVVAAALVVCFGTWYAIERTRLGAYLRAATENPVLVQVFGINVPVMVCLTYAFGVGLAGLAGVLAAPIYQVSPLMGSNIIVVVFAVVVIGGMGSILGSILSGLGLGLLEGLTKVYYPEASNLIVFVIMALVLMVKPSGLFGRAESGSAHAIQAGPARSTAGGEEGAPRRPLRMALWAGALVLLAAAPLAIYPVFLMKLMCFALFACAFNLLIGYTGLLSFGHAAFFGGAAYVTAHVAKVWGWGPELSILAGTAFAAAAGWLVGVVAIRRQGIYFAMVTLALSQMVYFLALQLPFTGGEDGIQNVPRGMLFGVIDLREPMAMYFFVMAIFVGGYLLVHRVVHSPFGQILKAIRENEQRAISLGYRADRYKLLAFVLSAGLAGLAGSTKALVVQVASLVDVQWQMSGEVILMTLLGGMGTLLGPVVGSALVVTLESYLAESGLPVIVVIGCVFMICVMLFRRGIVGEVLMLAPTRSRKGAERRGLNGSINTSTTA
jgi:branched-chain amino acid transport system permease protein